MKDTLARAAVARGRIWVEWRPSVKLSGYCPDFTKGEFVATVPWLRAPEWKSSEVLDDEDGPEVEAQIRRIEERSRR